MKRSYFIILIILFYVGSHFSWSVIFNINSFEQQEIPPLTITGHRGAAFLAPENTLASIYKAMDTKASRIEIDVRQTVEGRVVVIHDATVDRTTNGKGKVNEITYDSIKKLDAGSWFSLDYRDETIPSLEQVLQIFKSDIDLLIEIKADRDYDKSIENNVVDIIREYYAMDYCIIQSFDTDILRRIDSIEPQIRLHKLIVGKLHFLPLYFGTKLEFMNLKNYDYIDEISLHYYFANRKTVKNLKSFNKKINAWTVDDYNQAKHLYKIGVSGVITNDPNFPN